MLVTISIIAIISGIVLISFPTFASTIVLENLTHEIALVVRQAQVYGIGIKQALGGGFPSYGAHFDTSEPAQVIFFADTYPPAVGSTPAGDGVYTNDDNGTQTSYEDIIVERFLIQRGNTISGLCFDTSCTLADTIDITFTRPNPTAHIWANSAGDRGSAKITVSPPDGSVIGNRFIYVSLTGQIAVTSE
ncbi:MAG: hypothetical protein A3D67_01885 [Candidatus Lloydbacteria bacterium RIFCSPHIGHO2_02_FULL_51_22]|uniref:General secretion pathway GspH domain-containing protein n=2 Tax=Candidatus Lloydiibacteriota TaxID=1817910 RepID=A0A1G2DAE7_9BACT|nr:MAG: hypothetical protein A3D67_01885 [Candidatus Lloydbacteria bacterium RIFCSPHIGHO2_02_FULL_51_22]OGZ15566.1 MAG: hypothetical protein A3J08_01235 [Candidatus Lloydbacteria bacterium RIFCSPLOWO2_02_FULL_51_11]